MIKIEFASPTELRLSDDSPFCSLVNVSETADLIAGLIKIASDFHLSGAMIALSDADKDRVQKFLKAAKELSHE